MNGIYQVKQIEDCTKIKQLGFDIIIADYGAEMELIKKTTTKFLVQVNPNWDFEKIVNELNPYPQVVGWYLPDEPNMDSHMTPGYMKLTVNKIKKLSDKLIYVCIANVNSGRDYADWRRCGADVLMADIYPYCSSLNRWYRKAWEEDKWYGDIARKLYGIFSCFMDYKRMKMAVKANYPKGTVAVLQCFGGKPGSGMDEKFYLPNETELKRLISYWKRLGVKDFFTFVYDSNIHYNVKENHDLGVIISREIKK